MEGDPPKCKRQDKQRAPLFHVLYLMEPDRAARVNGSATETYTLQQL